MFISWTLIYCNVKYQNFPVINVIWLKNEKSNIVAILSITYWSHEISKYHFSQMFKAGHWGPVQADRTNIIFFLCNINSLYPISRKNIHIISSLSIFFILKKYSGTNISYKIWPLKICNSWFRRSTLETALWPPNSISCFSQ